MTVKIEWNEDVVSAKLSAATNKSALDIAKFVEMAAKQLAPIKTGAMRRSIKAKKSKFKDGGAIVSAGGGQQYYATFIELGRKKAAAHPFLRPAVEKSRATAIRLIKTALERELR